MVFGEIWRKTGKKKEGEKIPNPETRLHCCDENLWEGKAGGKDGGLWMSGSR